MGDGATLRPSPTGHEPDIFRTFGHRVRYFAHSYSGQDGHLFRMSVRPVKGIHSLLSAIT
jgi:hypothetical protein